MTPVLDNVPAYLLMGALRPPHPANGPQRIQIYVFNGMDLVSAIRSKHTQLDKACYHGNNCPAQCDMCTTSTVKAHSGLTFLSSFQPCYSRQQSVCQNRVGCGRRISMHTCSICCSCKQAIVQSICFHGHYIKSSLCLETLLTFCPPCAKSYLPHRLCILCLNCIMLLPVLSSYPFRGCMPPHPAGWPQAAVLRRACIQPRDDACDWACHMKIIEALERPADLIHDTKRCSASAPEWFYDIAGWPPLRSLSIMLHHVKADKRSRIASLPSNCLRTGLRLFS